MDIDTQRIRELLDKRDAIDREIIETTLKGEAPRKPIKCGHCQQEGHTARSCPTKA